MMTIDEIRSAAAEISAAMKSGAMNPALRQRFIEVRAALFQRGVYDPVLVRFDSATAPRATNEEIGEQLGTIAESLRG